MNIKPERVLVLAPHTDDGELGCGGTMARFRYEGVKVLYVAFSHIPEFNDDILRAEASQAAAILDIEIIFQNYPVRNFPVHRQAVLDDMVEFNRTLQPDLIFTPAIQDVHQDHAVITAEALRAFKHTSILGYEMPWNNYDGETTAFVSLPVGDVEKKIQAIQCYESQRHRPYTEADIIRGLARLRGVQAGVKYAEAFSVLRWMI